MKDDELVDELMRLKEKYRYTLHDLSKRLDIQVTTIQRWLKTKRINKVYAALVRERLRIG